MSKRLPPQPTNTALARFVQRLVDSMPWIMARHLRECREQRIILGTKVSALAQENTLLRRDYRNLFRPPISEVCRPLPDHVDLTMFDRPDMMEAVLRLRVEYPSLTYNVAFELRASCMAPLSVLGAEALRAAATEIAREHVDAHRDNLIRLALRGKTIEEMMTP